MAELFVQFRRVNFYFTLSVLDDRIILHPSRLALAFCHQTLLPLAVNRLPTVFKGEASAYKLRCNGHRSEWQPVQQCTATLIVLP